MTQSLRFNLNYRSKVPSLSLRAILIGLMVIQICVPFGLVGWHSVYTARQSVQILIRHIYQQAISQVQHHLDDYFAVPPQLNQLNLAAESLGLLPLDDFETLGHLFWKQMQTFNVSYVNYANEQGGFIGVERLDDGSLLIHETPSHNTNVFITYETDAAGHRKRGELAMDTEPVQEEGWYADAAAAERPVWSKIYQWDDKPEILSISSSYPTYADNGQMSGVLGVDLLLSDIGTFLKTVNISPHSELYILERNGNVVASSTQEAPFIVVDGQAQRLNAADSQDPKLQRTIAALEAQFGSLQTVDVVQAVEIRHRGSVIYEVPWSNEYGLDWLLVATVPESDFMAQVNANIHQMIFLGLLALAMAIWCASITARWITATLKNLDFAATAIADGQFSAARLNYRTPWSPLNFQELDSLNRSFRRMALRLQSNFQQMERSNSILEERVFARTQELRQSEEKFAKAFIQSPIAIAISTIEEGRFIEVNDTCCRVLGYAPSDLIGKNSTEIGLWLNLEERDRMIQDIQRDGFASAREVYLRTRSGRVICAEVAASKIELNGQPRLLYVGNDASARKQAETQLKTSLHEKEVLLKEIHHRVKNNLHVVSNLLDLQAEYIQDESIASMFIDSQSRIQTMALIHEQLYQSEDLQEIDLDAYIRRLIQNLMFSYGASSRIALSFDIRSVYLNIETAIPCGLLINELVTNAFKHAFPEQTAGTVQIHFQPDSDGYLSLTVQDDGIGIDPDVFSAKTASFGLKLIRILTRQLKAETSIQVDNGTIFCFRFRELSYQSRL